MAPEVIDLISSSPPPSQPYPGSPSSLCPLATKGNGGAPKRPMQREDSQKPASPSLFLSDDFGSDSGFPNPDSIGSKRARLTSSPPRPAIDRLNRAKAGMTSTRPGPAIRSTTSVKPKQVEFDPIEFTSSIEPEVSESQPIGRMVEIGLSKNVKPHHPLGSLDSDPFASSPLPEAPIAITASEKRQSTTIILDDFSDPFASSPGLSRPPLSPSKPLAPKPNPTTRNLQLSDPFASSPPPVATTLKENQQTSVNVAEKQRSRNEWDPISSSAPEPSPLRSPKSFATKSKSVGPAVISIDSESGDGSEDEFPDIANFDIAKYPPRPRSPLRRIHSDVVSSRSNQQKSGALKQTAERRARDKATQGATKAMEKEQKRLAREQLREANIRKKERAAALTEVNKVRTDKKVSTPEMILVMPSSIDEGLRVQVESLLDGLSVQHTSWESPAGNAFKWKRKVTSRFDEELGRWEPIPLQIKPENHVLVLLNAEEFVDIAVQDTLEATVTETKSNFPSHEILYVLEGINAWMRKNRNIRNRQFTSGVRSEDSSAPPASRGRRRNAAASAVYVSEDIVEDALLRLQVEHDVLIHHTSAPLETAQWVVHFTQHISTIPYKKQRDKATAVAGFCMESGQVRTGEDNRDTYVRMLQEIARVTAPTAYGIAGEFGSVSKLVSGLEEGGALRLEAVRKSANKDGAVSDRTVGQAVSRRIHKVFTGRDELSTDV